MIVEMAGDGAQPGFRLAGFVETRFAKAFVSALIIVGEIQAVLDQRRSRVGIVANAVPANPWVHQGKRKEKKKQERALKCPRSHLRIKVQGKWRHLCLKAVARLMTGAEACFAIIWRIHPEAPRIIY